MTNEKSAELLLDHYKDTFQHILYHWKVRNRLFMYILILLAIMVLDSYSPGSLSQLVNAYIKKILGADAPALNFSAIGSMAWFLLLCLVIQYYQRSIHVDRQYRYVSHLEDQICEFMDGFFITREGKSYFSRTGVYKPGEDNRRPVYLKAVGPLYVYFFPLVLIVVIMLKLIRESLPPKQITDFFNLFIGIIIVLYNILYVVWIKFRK
jgi:ABC-type multidrug transport system fused ATPase/permease subunit